MVSDWDSPPVVYADSLVASDDTILDFGPELEEAHHIIISNDSETDSLFVAFQKADEGAPPALDAPRRVFIILPGEVLTLDGVRFRGFRYIGDGVAFRVIAW